MEKEDRAPLQVVRIVGLVLPLLFKLALLYLKYKRSVKIKEKMMKKELKKVGMTDEMVKGLCSDIETITIKNILTMREGTNLFDNIPFY